MRKTSLGLALIAMTGVAQAAELGAVDDPIRLAINEWTGQHISAHVAGEMLKAAGYKVEYVTAGYYNMWQAMGEGELHASPEVWSSNVSEGYTKEKEAGRLEELGDLGLAAKEGLAYPAHVAELCPGLPAWEALADCATVFATADTIPQGRLLDYPADWGTPGADRVKGFGWPYKAVPAGSEGALIAELRASTEKKSPLLIMFWQPHWAMSMYDVKFVDLPEGNEDCFNDPAWGSNPNETHDCDFAPTRVFKVAWEGFDEKWPAAAEILSNLQITVEQQQPMMGKIDVDGNSVEDVVAEWMEANTEVWRPIVDAAVD